MRTSVLLATENLVWYRAVTLEERVAAPMVAQPASKPLEHAASITRERLQYCVSNWKAQKPFERAELFQQRLRLQNLTESDLRRIICEPDGEIRNRFCAAPDWVASIEAALSSPPTFEFHDFLSSRLS